MVGCESLVQLYISTRVGFKSLAKPTTLRKATKADKDSHGRFASKRNPAVEAKIIEVLSLGWSLGKAAKEAGVSRMSVNNWKNEAKLERDALDPNDPDYQAKFDANFFTRYEDAQEDGVDVLEDEATRRATGYSEPVFGKDGQIGERTLYSDPLMQMIMKGKRPNRYGVDRKEISGPNGQAIPISVEIEFVSAKPETKPSGKGKR